MTVFAELLSHGDVREECVLRGRFGFLAFHGGALEEVTDLVAREAATRSDSSYYGVIMPPERKWHVPSHLVVREESPLLDEFLSHVDTVIAVHGYGRRGYFASLLLGGRNRRLARHIGDHLRAALPAYRIIDDLDEIPVELRGQHQANPVNVPRHTGVQLELPPRVRGMSPLFWDWEGPGPAPHTEALIGALTEAVSNWGAERPEGC